MNSSGTAPPGGAACGHDHLVQFYETDAFLVAQLADFVVPALRGQDSAIVIATPEHRAAFAAAISAEGIDLDAAVRDGRYQALDAVEVLSMIMVDGAPDRARFEEIAAEAYDRASAGGRDVKAFGEMVALLWADGDVTSTIALEDLWSDFAPAGDWSLMCAYPMQGFDDDACAAFTQICAQHSTVSPAESYSLSMTADEQHQRTVAGLQQEIVALRAELARLRREQEGLLELIMPAAWEWPRPSFPVL